MSDTFANQSGPSPTTRRPRVFQAAYYCEPYYGSEQAVGWNWALEAAKTCDVWVVCCEDDCRGPIEHYLAEQGAPPHLNFLFLPHTRLERAINRAAQFVPYLGYAAMRMWQRSASRLAAELHQEIGFDLVHHVTVTGYREPGYLWKLGVPFVWGPIGGVQNCPWRFALSLRPEFIRENLRTVANVIQARTSRRVRQAARRASALLAANIAARQYFATTLGHRAELFKELGTRSIEPATRRAASPDQPLHVLWVGNCSYSKGAHLLIRALAQVPRDVAVQVRMVGDSSSRKGLMRLAQRLGVDDRIEWLGRLPHAETLAQYGWADVFAFTSLRDTTGTVLLESFAHGVPVVCLDHQGAQDFVNEQCGLKIPVTTPREVIAGLASALAECAADRERLHQMGAAAEERAQDYLWERQGERLAEVYRRVLTQHRPTRGRLPRGKDGPTLVASVGDAATRGNQPLSQSVVAAPVARFWATCQRRVFFMFVLVSCRPEGRGERQLGCGDDVPCVNLDIKMSAIDQLLRRINLRVGSVAVADQAVVGGANFLTAVIVGRACGTTQLGYFALALTAWYLILALLESLVTSPFTVFVHRLHEDHRKSYAGSALAQLAALATLAVAVTAGIAAFLWWVGSLELATVYAALTATMPFRLLRQFVRRYDYTYMHVNRALRIDGAVAVLQLGGLAAVHAVVELSAARAMWVVGIAQAIVSIGWLSQKKGLFRVAYDQLRPDFWKNWKLGKWLAASQFTMVAGAQTLPWIIVVLLDESATGTYAACVMLVGLAAPLMVAVQNVLAPRSASVFAGEGLPGLQRVVRKTTVVMAGVTGSLAAVLIAAGEPIVRLFFGSEFAGQGTVVMLLGLNGFAFAISLGAASGCTVLERSNLLFRSQLASTVVMLAVAVPLIKAYGLEGAAGAQLAGTTVGTIVLAGYYMAAAGALKAVPPPTGSACNLH